MGLVNSLFDEPSAFDRDRLAASLAGLASEGIYIGGSSWKYEGWLGQVYSRQRYMQRGRFSRKLFEATCLKEYAETFPAVCGDFSFYQFPSEEMWRRLFEQVPAGFRFAFKAPEQITCKIFPSHPRYGRTGGEENPAFLDAELLKTMFLAPLERYRDRTAVLIFEFGTFSRKSFAELSAFLDRLDVFLAALPAGFRYSVEIRNPEYLRPEYFECLRRHGVAHVFNAWSRMPELQRQMAMPESVTADFVVSRALLRYGRPYEDAVKAFSPYTEVRDPNPEARDALRVLVNRSREERRLAFIFVNNRLEGNAPATIISLVD
ncbi:MAG: DUF72 domain-containing protein [Acidobacteria bacterium]|nr:DUF72 domain-containing protein [Acidobacteriota bacterium]